MALAALGPPCHLSEASSSDILHLLTHWLEQMYNKTAAKTLLANASRLLRLYWLAHHSAAVM